MDFAYFVSAKPEFIRKPESDVKVLEGLPIILYCSATGEPKPNLNWLKVSIHFYFVESSVISHCLSFYFQDNVTITEPSENIQFMSSKKYLNILQSRQEDSGIYQCIAENEAGKNILQFNVNVLGKPLKKVSVKSYQNHL